jgi:thioredoxin reductase (NADPH)
MIYDVAIIGSGPAGLSAAIFCGRAQLKVLVMGDPKKAQLYLAEHIENYFGFPEPIDGKDLLTRGIKQAKKFGAEFLKEEVVGAKKGNDGFVLKTEKKKTVNAKAIIIATGIPIVLSGIKNEVELRGKGVSYCVNCDGALFKNKRIVIIGNGNHAAEAALEATSYSKSITLVSHAGKFEISQEYQKELGKNKIKTVNQEVKEFVGKGLLKGLKLENGDLLECDAAFLACGNASSLDFSNELALDTKENMIIVDEKNMTSMPGVFAAGNCMGNCRQIARNVGDGANAAVNVIKYLKMTDVYMDFGQK